MKSSLLMITGWAHEPDSMQPLADALAEDFYTQILTGAQVLTENYIPKADFVIGWSMGGMLAMELLPVSCRKLVLLSSTARFCATDGYDCGVPQKVLRHMIAQLKHDPAATLEEFYKNVNAPKPFHTCAGVKLPLNQLVEGLEYLLVADLRRKITRIEIPVLLLHGEKDRIIPPEASDFMAQHLPYGTCLRMVNEGHLMETTAAAPHILNFLNQEAP